MNADYSKSMNYEQPMLIELIKDINSRTLPVLINTDGNYNMENRYFRTTIIDSISCIKLSVAYDKPI